MTRKEPSHKEWNELFAAAKRFKQHECWNDMHNSDVFGVKNPETGEIGYCCVMGNAGQHYSLAVYKGSVGLDGLLKIFNDEVDATGFNALHVQHCLMASFEDRKFIDKKDYALIKKLGLSFRGKNAWPLFRDYTPGFYPWYITSDDARFLTIALDQSIIIAKRVKEDPDLLFPEDDEFKYLVRVTQKKNDTIIWNDAWLVPKAINQKHLSVDFMKHHSYKTRFEHIKKNCKKRNDVWEVDISYNPQPIQEKKEQRPYYPKVMMFADHHTEMILSFAITQPDTYQKEYVDEFLSFVEKNGFLPKEIIAADEEFLALIQPVTKELGIDLFKTDYLDVIEEVKQTMGDFF
ncbi:MAG: hypothetical protein DRN27_08895 [Thermoplasmata archaeon]|nr:MAG: hypothetical protein DRN27_08895 [Thermoplasmata archaeon]